VGKSTPKIDDIDPKNRKIIRNGYFVGFPDGVLRDTKTWLEWIAGPDIDLEWEVAIHWVYKLKINGGGWRMPTLEQVKTLYQAGKGPHNLTSLIDTNEEVVWTGEPATLLYGSPQPVGFNFDIGT